MRLLLLLALLVTMVVTFAVASQWQWTAQRKMMDIMNNNIPSAAAQKHRTSQRIHLRNGNIGREHALNLQMTNFDTAVLHHTKLFGASETQTRRQQHPFLVKWVPERTVINSRFVAELSQEYGISVQHYLPHHAHLVYATTDQISHLMQNVENVDFVASYDPLLRVSEQLLDESTIETIGEHVEKLRQTHGVDDTKSVSHASDRILIAVSVETEDSAQLAQEIAQALQANVRVVSSRKLLIIVDGADKTRARELSMLVAHHRQVVYVEQMDSHIAHSENKFSRGVMQAHAVGRHPFTDEIGLSAKDQVIGYGDSGIDVYSCFMFDPDTEVPFYDHFDNNTIVESKHRKISGYYTFIDNVDDLGGHGTHVGGTLAGKMAFNKPSDYNGMAHDAKLAFVDIGCSTPGGCKCADHPFEQRMCPCIAYPDQKCPADDRAIYLPLDLYEGYFPFTYALGARIFSNSLGGRIGESYSLTSHEIDRFMWENPDFLVLWSAGNSGRESGFMTLTGGFKQIKSGVVVGASAAAKESWLAILDKFRDYDDKAKALQQSLSNSWRCECGGTCSAADCEAIAELTTHEACCKYMNITHHSETDDLDITCKTKLPAAVLSDYITNVVSGCCQKCTQTELLGPKTDPITVQSLDFQSLASFSSLGPAIDGRIKPDIVAPGFYVLSAKSHASDPASKCTEELTKDDLFNIKDMAGTSMAAPTASGVAALVRSFFVEGHYPAEENADPEHTEPSAALVKAVMIASARPMTGIARLRDRFSAYTPSQRRFFEGFGLLNLIKVLKIKGKDNLTPFSLFVVDKKPIETNIEHRWTIEIPNSDSDIETELAVTLVWTDYPGSPAASYALVNDLDLKITTVTDEGEKVDFYGNALDDSMQQNQFDRLNSVEKIIISKPQAGKPYVVTVRGFNVPHGPQPYALVITGPGFVRKQVEQSYTEVDHDPQSFFEKNIMLRVWVFVSLLVLLTLSLTVAIVSVIGSVAFALSVKSKFQGHHSGIDEASYLIQQDQ